MSRLIRTLLLALPLAWACAAEEPAKTAPTKEEKPEAPAPLPPVFDPAAPAPMVDPTKVKPEEPAPVKVKPEEPTKKERKKKKV